MNYAAAGGFDKPVRQLISAGANVALTTLKGNTPLHTAATAEIAELLLQAYGRLLPREIAAYVNQRNEKGQSALHTIPSVHAAEILIAHGANVTLADKNNNTALHLDDNVGKVAVIMAAIRPEDRQAFLDKKNKAGLTALDIAIKGRKGTTILGLLRGGYHCSDSLAA